MRKFIVHYNAPQSWAEDMKNVSPEDMQKGMDQWMVWAKSCGDNLVDMGSPLGNGRVISQSGVVGCEKGLNGYSILQAEDMDSAVAMLKDHPHIEWSAGCTIEIFESIPMH